jgi:O-antigen/teichoic acid export membrane protein
MSDGGLRQKVVSSFLWKFLERFGYQAIQLVVQIVLARILVPEDFGAVALIAVFVSISAVFVQSGLNTALIRFKDVTKSDLSTVFWFSFAMSVVLYLIIFLVAPLVAAFYELPVLEPALRVLALQLIINSLNSVQVAKISRDLEFRKLFFSTLVAIVLSGAAGIVIACLGFGVWALVFQQLIFAFVSCVVLFFLVDWQPRFVFDRRRFGEFFVFGWKILCSSCIDTAGQGLYDLVVGKAFSKTELGFFSMGRKFPALLSNLFDGSIQSVMLPAMARFQDDKQQLKSAMSRAMSVSTFGIAPIMATLAVVATPLVTIVFGEKWLPCVPFMQLFCVAYALWPIHTSNLQSLNALGRSDVFLKLEIIKTLISIAVLAIAALVFKDIYLVAGGLIITGILNIFVNSWPMKRILGYGPLLQLRDVAPAYILSAVCAAAAFTPSLVLSNPWLLVICETVIMVGLYCLLAWLFRVPAFKEVGGILKERFFSPEKREDQES